MKLFPSLPDNAHLSDVYRTFPEHVRPVLEYHDLLLRGEGPLSIAERELLAAYVSGLNACRFCYGAHRLYAQAFGVDVAVADAMVADLDTAPIADRLKPLIRYAAKLQSLPPGLIEADAKAVYDAGWSERALFDVVQIAALFHYMNRVIEGTGVTFDYLDHQPDDSELGLRRTRTYRDYARSLGIEW